MINNIYHIKLSIVTYKIVSFACNIVIIRIRIYCSNMIESNACTMGNSSNIYFILSRDSHGVSSVIVQFILIACCNYSSIDSFLILCIFR